MDDVVEGEAAGQGTGRAAAAEDGMPSAAAHTFFLQIMLSE